MYASCNLISIHQSSTWQKIKYQNDYYLMFKIFPYKRFYMFLFRKKFIGVVSLSFLLGLTWMTGFFMYPEMIAFAFVFTVSNGLQGVSIFITRCLLNQRIRTALKDSSQRLRKDFVKKCNMIKKKLISQ